MTGGALQSLEDLIDAYECIAKPLFHMTIGEQVAKIMDAVRKGDAGLLSYCLTELRGGDMGDEEGSEEEEESGSEEEEENKTPKDCLNIKGTITPLNVACELGNVEIVCLLLEAGAKPLLRDKNGNSAVHYAVTHIPVLQLLRRHNVSLNVQNDKGQSAFHQIAEKSSEEHLMALVDIGISPIVVDEDGVLALNLIADFDTRLRIELQSKWIRFRALLFTRKFADETEVAMLPEGVIREICAYL